MGEALSDGIENAEDFLCGALYHMEEDGQRIPVPSDANSIEKESADIITLISVDTEDYRRWHESKVVKKTLTIPSWLNEKATGG
ncbi:MAG: type II toxin-antitoxin system HicB family antitoxin [Dehalococcoidia bacterium]|nr:type II toxin-antitoxin system HicB family antitoxin [Dehalococcoidia bacterium]